MFVAVLVLLYFGLTLFGLYQYKAHNRKWGMKLVVWMSAVVLLVGIGVRFNFLLLPVFLTVGFCLAYFVGWRLIGRRFSGWKQHLIRGLAFALCLGPLAAIRYCELTDFDKWLMGLGDTSFMGIYRFFLYGLPGFFLVGAISFLVSFGCELWRGAPERLTTAVWGWRAKLGCVLLLLALLLCVNWYIAGAFLYSSAARGQTRILAWVLWSRPGSVNAKDTYGWTPLHEAAFPVKAEVVKVLLKAGAEVNAKDNSDSTPLHWAAAQGHTEVVRILLKAGADINAKDNGDPTPLHWAAHNGRTEVVKVLLKAGADVNAKNGLGRTPLHLAAAKAHIKLAQFLIKAGAEVNAKDSRSLTPLHRAAWSGEDTEIISILIKAGADVNARDKDGQTPLDRADGPPAREREIKQLLREHGGKSGRQL